MPKRIAYQKSRPRKLTKIKAWREFRGMSQEAVAERLETSGATISRIESGTQPYTQDTLEGMAEIFDTDVVSLLVREPSDNDRMWRSIIAGLTEPLTDPKRK